MLGPTQNIPEFKLTRQLRNISIHPADTLWLHYSRVDNLQFFWPSQKKKLNVFEFQRQTQSSWCATAYQQLSSVPFRITVRYDTASCRRFLLFRFSTYFPEKSHIMKKKKNVLPYIFALIFRRNSVSQFRFFFVLFC